MTRHARNATNSAVYTYHERAKDAKASGYGSEKMRLSKDAIKGFDCCSLSLQPCKNPVVTPEGWLYDKEAILQYILDKKQEFRKQLKAFETQNSREFKNLHDEAEKDAEKQKKDFEKREQSIVSGAGGSSKAGSSKSTLTSFWVPNLTPQAEETKVKRPEKKIICPMSGKSLKAKNLIDIKFTEIKAVADSKTSLIAREERYCCPVTNDVLRNSTPVAVLRPTGDVVTVDCVNKIIKKDMMHPLTGEKLSEEDIIYLQRGGTGFSSANEHSLKAKKYRPNIAIS